MQNYRPEQVINGTFGELWIDDMYMAEVTGFEAKAALEKSEVNQTRTLAKGYKITGIDCKGTVKLNKVTSYFINLLSDNIKAGKTTVCTITSKLDDPDSTGSERIKLTGCTFDELTLANWEGKKLGEESVPFSFSGWEVLDSIS
ncbi:MAG: phage tail tube protein [Lachnospiraceae bacterium]|nr:phage tail tube protein [Lachnospiraceae bacterium]